MADLGIGGHHSAKAGKDEWLTPPFVLDALGDFDLDPCSPINRPWPTAAEHYTIEDNGLHRPWHGRVWLNPPYGRACASWMERMVEHGIGTALIFARTETDMFFSSVWSAATAIRFLEGRLNFHHVDGSRANANAGAPSVLIAYGQADADVLADCGLPGHFIGLRIPVIIVTPEPTTWKTIIVDILRRSNRAMSLASIYSMIAGHAKTARNRHWQAKVRQILQGDGFERVGPGIYQISA